MGPKPNTVVKSMDKRDYLLMFAHENSNHANWKDKKKQLAFSLGFTPFLNTYFEDRKEGAFIEPFSRLYIGDDFIAAIDDWTLNNGNKKIIIPLASDVALVESKFTRTVKRSEKIYVSVHPYSNNSELEGAMLDLLSKQNCTIPGGENASKTESILSKMCERGQLQYDSGLSLVMRTLR